MPLPDHTTGEAIFNLLNEFITSCEIDWKKCVGICTDGARAMSGCKSGLRALVKNVAPEATWQHCCIHREALVTKRIPAELKIVLDEVVKIINFIKSRPLNHRISKSPNPQSAITPY